MMIYERKRLPSDSSKEEDRQSSVNQPLIIHNDEVKPPSVSCLCPARGMEVSIGNGGPGVHQSASCPSSLSSSSFASRARTKLSHLQLVCLNAVVFGLELCASAAFTYIPPMLLKSGIGEERMSIILGIGPFLGFIFVPWIGRSSDRCRSSFGRRRPYILFLGLCLLMSLIVIPYGEHLAVVIFGVGSAGKTATIIFLIVGAVLLDFTSQVSLTPCEALLSDACRPTKQEERGFMIYSVMVSLGGCVGYLITAYNWEGSQWARIFGGQEQSAFSWMIFLFTFTLFLSLAIAQEQPLAVIQANEQQQAALMSSPTVDIATKLDEIHQHIVRHKEMNGALPVPTQDPGYESDSNRSASEEGMITTMTSSSTSSYTGDKDRISKPNSFTLFPDFISDHLCHIPLTRWSILNYRSFFYLLAKNIYRYLPSNLTILFELPLVLRRLACANFFSWTAVMSFNLFYTDYVGQMIYYGDPNASEDSLQRAHYDEGVRMGSWGLFFHCVTSGLYGFVLERMTRRFGLRTTYFFGMLTFTLSMFVMVTSRSIYIVNCMAAFTGLGYATLTSIPFMLVNTYHTNPEIYYFDIKADPTHGIGSDISSLDSAYFLSQVILSLSMSYIVHLTGSVVSYIVVAGSMGAVACACVSRLVITRTQVATEVMLMSDRNKANEESHV